MITRNILHRLNRAKLRGTRINPIKSTNKLARRSYSGAADDFFGGLVAMAGGATIVGGGFLAYEMVQEEIRLREYEKVKKKWKEESEEKERISKENYQKLKMEKKEKLKQQFEKDEIENKKIRNQVTDPQVLISLLEQTKHYELVEKIGPAHFSNISRNMNLVELETLIQLLQDSPQYKKQYRLVRDNLNAEFFEKNVNSIETLAKFVSLIGIFDFNKNGYDSDPTVFKKMVNHFVNQKKLNELLRTPDNLNQLEAELSKVGRERSFFRETILDKVDPDRLRKMLPTLSSWTKLDSNLRSYLNPKLGPGYFRAMVPDLDAWFKISKEEYQYEMAINLGLDHFKQFKTKDLKELQELMTTVPSHWKNELYCTLPSAPEADSSANQNSMRMRN